MYSRTVLVVEDEPLIRLNLAEALEDEGCTVFEASNVLEAVAILGSQEIDALITDVDMPGPLNGLDLVRLIKTCNRRIAIIVTSGGHRGSDLDLPTDSCFLAKPYLIGDITGALTATLQLADPMPVTMTG